MNMQIRNCAGGIVFNKGKVFLVKNDKDEWTLPKAIVKGQQLTSEAALNEVQENIGLDVTFASNEGETNYEFPNSKMNPICNKVTWYIMKSKSDKYKLKDSQKITAGGFFPIDEALNKISYSQDKSIVNLAFNKLQE